MELALFVYFVEMLQPLNFLLFSFSSFGFLTAVVALLISLESELQPKFLKASKISVSVSLVCLILFVLTPTTKTAYTMAGAYAAQKLVQSDTANEVGQKVYKIINQKLDSYIVMETKKGAK